MSGNGHVEKGRFQRGNSPKGHAARKHVEKGRMGQGHSGKSRHHDRPNGNPCDERERVRDRRSGQVRGVENPSGGISTELDNLTCELIGTCLDELAVNGEAPVMLAYCGVSGEPEMFVFDEDDPQECIAAARSRVRKLGSAVDAYAISYLGFVTDEEGRGMDSLIVEFGERGADTAYSAYVPYRFAGDEERFESGEPLAAGEEPLLL